MAEKITLDASQFLTALDAIDANLKQVEGSMGDVQKASKKVFAPEGNGALQHAKEIEKLQSEYKQLKDAAATLKTALKNAYDPRAIDEYAKALKTAESGLKKMEQAGAAVGANLKKVGKEGSLAGQLVAESFGAITKAAVILAVIDQVVKLSKYSVELSENTKLAAKQFEGFTKNADKAKGIVADLTAFSQKKLLPTDEVFQAGRGLLAFGESASNLTPVLSRIADISAATGKNFNELTTIYGKARTSGVLYAEDINQLVDAGIPIISEFAKQLGVSESEVKKLASEGKISFEELQLAFFNLTKEGAKFAGQAEAQSETLKGAWAKAVAVVTPALNTIGGAISYVLRTALEGFTGVAQAIGNLFSDTPTAKIEVDYSGRDKYEQAREDVYEQERLEKEAAKKRKELAAANAKELASIERDKTKLRIEAMKEGEAKEIAQENFRFKELKAALRKYHLDTSEAEMQHSDNLFSIRTKYFLERYAKEQDAIEREKELIKEGYDELAAAEAEGAKTRLDALKVNEKARKDAAELDSAYFEQAILASNEVFYAKKRSDQEVEAYERKVADMRKVFQLTQQQEELQRTLDFNTELSTAEKATLQLRIKNLQTEIGQINSGLGSKQKDGKPQSIWQLLGISNDPNDEKLLDEAVGRVIDGIKMVTDARKQAADEERAVADERVSRAEQDLDREIQLAELGFATNVTLKQKELADARKVQAQKIQEQRKAARQQALIDAALQTGSLVTAGAQMFKAHAGIPFAGVGIAIGFIALMLSTFAKLKANSKNAATFAEGGEATVDGNSIIVGPSHAGGGVGIEAEGGEFITSDGKRLSIVKKKMTAKYFDLLSAVNKDDRAAIMRHALDLQPGPSYTVDQGKTLRAIGQDETTVRRREQEKAKEARQDETNNLLKKILAESQKNNEPRGERSPDGKTVKKGNVTKYY